MRLRASAGLEICNIWEQRARELFDPPWMIGDSWRSLQFQVVARVEQNILGQCGGWPLPRGLRSLSKHGQPHGRAGWKHLT
jgi:hypothetical protein